MLCTFPQYCPTHVSYTVKTHSCIAVYVATVLPDSCKLYSANSFMHCVNVECDKGRRRSLRGVNTQVWKQTFSVRFRKGRCTTDLFEPARCDMSSPCFILKTRLCEICFFLTLRKILSMFMRLWRLEENLFLNNYKQKA